MSPATYHSSRKPAGAPASGQSHRHLMIKEMSQVSGENQSDVPTAKRSKRNYEDTMVVLVGTEEQRFLIHTAVACANSSFFKVSCSENWIEGQERLVRLPEHTAQTFEVFIHWAYSRELDLSTMDDEKLLAEAEQLFFTPPSYYNCAQVWSLAHYLGSPELQNRVIDRMIEKLLVSDSGVSNFSLQYIWSISPPDSPIRNLMIDATVRMKRRLPANLEELPTEIVREALHRYFKGESRDHAPPTWEDRCKYHEHAEGEPKCEQRTEEVDTRGHTPSST